MGRSKATTKDAIANAAYQRACELGLAALSVREVARDCGVSVGTLYRYYPDKADLVAAVIERFWKRVAFPEEGATCLSYVRGERLVGFCRRVERTLAQALAEFRTNWLGEIGALDARSRQRGRSVEHAYFEHVCARLEQAARDDDEIDRAALERIGAAELARFVWENMLLNLRGETSSETLFAVLEQALYR